LPFGLTSRSGLSHLVSCLPFLISYTWGSRDTPALFYLPVPDGSSPGGAID